MFPPVFLSILDDVASTLGDIGFVLVIISFCYLAFTSSMTFGNNVLIFTLVLAVLAYVAFAFPILLVVLAFVALIMGPAGQNFQMMVQFGINPITQAAGLDITGQEYQGKAQQEFMETQAEKAEERLRMGQASQADMQLLQSMQEQKQAQQQQQRMRPPTQ